MHENRETSGTSRSNQDRDRPEKANSRTADRHVAEESDRAIVPVNLSNNEGQTSAEIGEGRARAKENIAPHSPDTERETGVPKDWAVCVKRLGKGDGTDSRLCSTI